MCPFIILRDAALVDSARFDSQRLNGPVFDPELNRLVRKVTLLFMDADVVVDLILDMYNSSPNVDIKNDIGTFK